MPVWPRRITRLPATTAMQNSQSSCWPWTVSRGARMIRANPPMRRARLLAHDRDIKFEQDIGPGEPRRDNAGRYRPDIAEMLADRRIDGRTIGTIANEDRDLADVLERSVCLRENSREVAHRK